MPRIKKSVITDKSAQPIVEQEAEFLPTLSEEIKPENEIIIPLPIADKKSTPRGEKKKDKEIINESNNSLLYEDEIHDPQAPSPKISKEQFKQLHIKDTYWLENDIYQTILDMTKDKKGAKALIINQALKDYLKKNDIEIKPLRVKEKKD